LAEILRLARAHRRPVAGDSEIAEHIKVAARAHQSMIWSRVRQVNTLRSMLREYYPADLAAAPSPDLGRRLSQARLESLLRKAGRQRNVTQIATQCQEPEELLRHITDHQSLRHQTSGAGPLRPEPAARRRLVPPVLLRPLSSRGMSSQRENGTSSTAAATRHSKFQTGHVVPLPFRAWLTNVLVTRIS
jgi:hypothetical protein